MLVDREDTHHSYKQHMITSIQSTCNFTNLRQYSLSHNIHKRIPGTSMNADF